MMRGKVGTFWVLREEGKWGCGKWEKPMIKNPKYKGKWKAPLIDNPNYKGVWKPKQIDNPNFFEDKRPSDFTKIVISRIIFRVLLDLNFGLCNPIFYLIIFTSVILFRMLKLFLEVLGKLSTWLKVSMRRKKYIIILNLGKR